MNILVGLGCGLVFLFMCLKSYTLGIKHGKQLFNKEVPQIKINPMQPIKDVVHHIEEKKEEQKFESALEDYWERR